jgi:hypothetical protein
MFWRGYKIHCLSLPLCVKIVIRPSASCKSLYCCRWLPTIASSCLCLYFRSYYADMNHGFNHQHSNFFESNWQKFFTKQELSALCVRILSSVFSKLVPEQILITTPYPIYILPPVIFTDECIIVGAAHGYHWYQWRWDSQPGRIGEVAQSLTYVWHQNN